MPVVANYRPVARKNNMAIEIRCPKCGRHLRLPATAGAAQVRCAGCAVRLRVPSLPDSVAADAEAANPFAPPQVQFAGEPQSGAAEEPIDFEPLVEDVAFPEPASPSRRVALALSDGQLRDALKAAASIRSSVDFLACLLFISLAIQGFVVVVSVIAFASSLGRTFDASGLVWIGVNVASALVTGVSAVLLKDYGSRLKEFVESKEADGLVESLGSGSRYWLWTAVMVVACIGLGILLIFAAMGFAH